MNAQAREVSLKLKSRPLRCAFLVRNREEVLDAIALYTHIWGGQANTIFPIPTNDEELESLKLVLTEMNPDYILTMTGELSVRLTEMLEKLAISIRLVSKSEIERHINGNRADLLRLTTGKFSHMRSLFSKTYYNPLERTDIRLIKADERFRLDVALHQGLPSKKYCDYLIEFLGAESFALLDSREDLLKYFLTITKFVNPISLTLTETSCACNILNDYAIKSGDPEVLWLFLDNNRDISVVTAFWNIRWYEHQNKVFLSMEEFLRNIRFYALQIIEFIPHIRAVTVVTSYDRDEALELVSYLKQIFIDLGKEILVEVIYRGFHFAWIPGTLSSLESNNFTRVVTDEGGVRFEPIIPYKHEQTDFAFGYDAEVRFTSGRRFFNPLNLVSSKLLTNELWRLESADENRDNLGEMWLKRGFTVRAATNGISGISIPGKECTFFIHSDEVVITRQLKEIGFEVKPNEHTRYAQGLVKKLGGVGRVSSLIDDGGVDILSVLSVAETDQGGLNQEKILSALMKKRGFTHAEAKVTIEQKLKPLLANGLLQRGFCYKCPNCDLKAWISIEKMKEFIECEGCAEKEQLPLEKLQFTYKPNELAAQLVRKGGIAVLMTASTLQSIPSISSSFIQFGGDFLTTDGKNKFAEVDLFWLTEQALIISECKSIFIKDEVQKPTELEQKITRLKRSLETNIDIADRIFAGAVVIGISTNLNDTSILLKTVTDMLEVAKSKKIGLHIIINGLVYLWGSPGGQKPREIHLDNLLVKDIPSNDNYVGESLSEYRSTFGRKGFFDKKVLMRWESELKD